MRLIDADMLSPDRDYYDNSICSGYDAVSCQQIDSAKTVQAIPLDKVKQAREEMNDLDYLINDAKYSDRETRVCNVDILVNEFYEIMDKLIAESEE